MNPNLIETDPLKINAFLKLGNNSFYHPVSVENENFIPALPETEREEILCDYKKLNRNYHRTTNFENGIAKLLSVKNRDFYK